MSSIWMPILEKYKIVYKAKNLISYNYESQNKEGKVFCIPKF